MDTKAKLLKAHEEAKKIMPAHRKNGKYADISQALENTGVHQSESFRVAEARMKAIDVAKQCRKLMDEAL